MRALAQSLLDHLVRTAFRLVVVGADVVPTTGAFVLVANHGGHADAPALLAALPAGRRRDTHPLAAADYFFRGRLLGSLVRLLVNAVPLDRTARCEVAVAPAVARLAAGHGVLVFPEGTRSRTGELGPFRKGVGALLAGRPHPAIPAYVHGSHAILPPGAWWPRLRPLTIAFGGPVTYVDEPDTREGWARIAADLERRVRALAAAPAGGGG
jgi:1-acyl-sn-glycerol-3-phosphate acyltransferase